MRGYRLGATLFEAPAAKSAVLVMPATARAANVLREIRRLSRRVRFGMKPHTGWRRND